MSASGKTTPSARRNFAAVTGIFRVTLSDNPNVFRGTSLRRSPMFRTGMISRDGYCRTAGESPAPEFRPQHRSRARVHSFRAEQHRTIPDVDTVSCRRSSEKVETEGKDCNASGLAAGAVKYQAGLGASRPAISFAGARP